MRASQLNARNESRGRKAQSALRGGRASLFRGNDARRKRRERVRAARDEAIMSPGWFDGRSGARRWTSWARERAERGSTITDERVGAGVAAVSGRTRRTEARAGPRVSSLFRVKIAFLARKIARARSEGVLEACGGTGAYPLLPTRPLECRSGSSDAPSLRFRFRTRANDANVVRVSRL